MAVVGAGIAGGSLVLIVSADASPSAAAKLDIDELSAASSAAAAGVVSSGASEPAGLSAALVAPPKGAQQFKYVLVGGGTASHFALLAIRRRDPDASILMIANESEPPYPRPQLSKFLWFKKPRSDERPRFFRYPLTNYAPEKVTVVLGHAARDLDLRSRTITLDDGRQFHYEKCLLATGGTPRLPGDIGIPLAEDAAADVTTFRTTQDFARVEEWSRTCKDILVIGGGLLGSEITCALVHQSQTTGVNVHQVFPENGVLGYYVPQYLSSFATTKLQQLGADIRPHTNVNSISKLPNGRLEVTLETGLSLEVDKVVLALGIKPNVGLAQRAGLEIDPTNGGIVVNAELEARSGVFAAGDVCSFYDATLGRRRVEHQDHSEFSGLRAGHNMTGDTTPYTYQSLSWSALGDIRIEMCGIIDPTLEAVSVWQSEKNSSTADFRGQPDAPRIISTDPYTRGIVYYLKQGRVVGVVLWNVRHQGDAVRALLKSNRSWDRSELSKAITL